MKIQEEILSKFILMENGLPVILTDKYSISGNDILYDNKIVAHIGKIDYSDGVAEVSIMKVKPVQFIDISFKITPTGASFE